MEKKAHISNFITEPSHRKVWDKFLVHNHMPISKPIWSSPFLLQLTRVIWLNFSVNTVYVGSRAKTCDSGQTGEAGKLSAHCQAGAGCWWSTGQFCTHSQFPSVEEFHFSAGSHCKGSDLNEGQEDVREQGGKK